MILSEWHGMIAYVMARCRIPHKELQVEMKVSKAFLSRVLNREENSEYIRSRVTAALRSCVMSRDPSGVLWSELTAPFHGV